jgi:catecholate siderophore receptor
MGLRYDHFDTEPTPTPPPAAPRARTTASSSTGRPAWSGNRRERQHLCPTPPPPRHRRLLGEGSEGNPCPPATLSSDLEPEETKNYEIGTKWDLFHDRLSLTAAVFRTEKENARVQVDTTTYENVGETRVKV